MFYFVKLGAFYVNIVDQNIIQINDELIKRGTEIKKIKDKLESIIN